MKADGYHPWLHGLAWLTAVIALLPISVGALVTTVDAGMAFPDWPTSHGQGMLAFPWWQSRGDEFLEHGHRLAGMLVGIVTLALAAVAFLSESRDGVRAVVAGVLTGVIFQGMLGGWRVLADERVIAMLHALFAAVVFSLMAVLVVITGPRWSPESTLPDSAAGKRALRAGVLLVVLLAVQYVLGSLLRHLAVAEAWLIHPWFAIAVVAAAVWFAVTSWRAGLARCRRWGLLVVLLVVAQASLGLVTWGARYGFPQWGVVAVQQSTLQVAVRSLHKVLGLLTFMSAVVAMAELWWRLPTSRQDGVCHQMTKKMPEMPLAAGGAS